MDDEKEYLEILIEENKKYLKEIKNLNEDLLQQIAQGWITKADIKNFDYYFDIINLYEDSINKRDDVEILLSKRLLENEIMKIATYAIESKLKNFGRFN